MDKKRYVYVVFSKSTVFMYKETIDVVFTTKGKALMYIEHMKNKTPYKLEIKRAKLDWGEIPIKEEVFYR
jgi:hypothetical protein